jgi:transposase InsO family protein
MQCVRAWIGELKMSRTDRQFLKADVAETLRFALNAAGLHQATVRHRPRWLSDNGRSYLSAQLGAWIEEHGMRHARGQPYHPMTQSIMVEVYHRSLKNRICWRITICPVSSKCASPRFVDFYNYGRYHKSRGDLTPANIYFGRGSNILAKRQNIKHQTIELRRRLHQQAVA